MGRCYEFGAVVVSGCDHPMVVVAEGGACACTECAAFCRGKFSGCPDIVARPGYVPVLAPKTVRTARVRVNGSAPAPAATEVPASHQEHTVVDELLTALSSERAVVEQLTTELARLHKRVDELETAITKLSQSTLWDLLRRT